VGGAVEVLGVGVAFRHARLADLHLEAAVARELEDLRVLLRIAGEPDVVLRVHEDAVLVLRPVVARAGTTPRLDEIALAVELHHRWGGNAARIAWRVKGGALLLLAQGPGALDDPHVVLGIPGPPPHPAQDPPGGHG